MSQNGSIEAGAWLKLDIAESHHYGERDWTSVNLKGVYEQKCMVHAICLKRGENIN